MITFQSQDETAYLIHHEEALTRQHTTIGIQHIEGKVDTLTKIVKNITINITSENTIIGNPLETVSRLINSHNNNHNNKHMEHLQKGKLVS